MNIRGEKVDPVEENQNLCDVTWFVHKTWPSFSKVGRIEFISGPDDHMLKLRDFLTLLKTSILNYDILQHPFCKNPHDCGSCPSDWCDSLDTWNERLILYKSGERAIKCQLKLSFFEITDIQTFILIY